MGRNILKIMKDSKKMFKDKTNPGLNWWKEARFGMFIHWGLYSIPAGKWKDRDYDGIGEWIGQWAKIPKEEYRKLAAKFNPKNFDADKWIQLACDAGMKYIVITAKHADGFAMYNSACSNYNIVSSSPFGRDPIKDLAKACKKNGIKLCFYYSQCFDWDHSGAIDIQHNKPSQKDFAEYLHLKVKPQLQELLTQYGPIGLIWFDNPFMGTREQCQDIVDFVHQLQPKCLVSGRIGFGLGDYESMGDNEMPHGPIEGNYEMPATLNDTWGFKKNDRNWKSVKELLYLLVDTTSKGVNYLLNIGPSALGVVPKPSVNRLEKLGEWLQVNGDAIYGTQASPFPYSFDWGGITQKKEKLYLLIKKWPKGKFYLYGLKNKVKKAYLLSDKKNKLKISQTYDRKQKLHALELNIPHKQPDKYVSVVVIETTGAPVADKRIIQQPDGAVTLPAYMASLEKAKPSSSIRIHPRGIIADWSDKSDSVSWNFEVFQPGAYEVKLTTASLIHGEPWQGGHKVKLSVVDNKLEAKLTADETANNKINQYYPEAATNIGKLKIEKAGKYTLRLEVEEFRVPAKRKLQLTAEKQLNKNLMSGLNIVSIQFRPLGL